MSFKRFNEANVCECGNCSSFGASTSCANLGHILNKSSRKHEWHYCDRINVSIYLYAGVCICMQTCRQSQDWPHKEPSRRHGMPPPPRYGSTS